MRILALDLGEKRIGLALSDELGLTAQGLPTLSRKNIKDDIVSIRKVITEGGVDEILVGWPLNLNGSENRQTKFVSEFMEVLKKNFNLPIKSYDERLTSLMVEKSMLEANLSRSKRKNLADKLSAQVILQSYLDSLKHA